MRKIYLSIVNIPFIKSIIDSIKKRQAAAVIIKEEKAEEKALQHATSCFDRYAKMILNDYAHFGYSEYWFLEFFKFKGEYKTRNDDHIYIVKFERGFLIEFTYQAQMMETERYGNSYSAMNVCGYKLTSVILRKGNQGYARIPSFKKQWIEYREFTIG